MSLTDEQLAERRKHITATDIAALAGLSPSAGPTEVYLSKVYGIGKRAGRAATLGHILEPGLVQWAAREAGRPLAKVGLVVVAADGLCSATPDGVLDDGTTIEAKTAGLTGPNSPFLDYFGRSGTDQVPDYYAAQMQYQMYCIGPHSRRGLLPALLGNHRDPRRYKVEAKLYRVERDEEVIERLVWMATCFWRDHVEPRVPPPGYSPSDEQLAEIERIEREAEAATVASRQAPPLF